MLLRYRERIKRFIKWAVSEELAPPSAYEATRTVSGLRYGRTTARETEVWRNDLHRHRRKSPLTPSQAARKPKPNPKRAKRERYDRPGR